MKRFFAKLTVWVAVLGLILASPVSVVKAEETAPIWTSNFVNLSVEKGKSLDITVTASGGSNTKIGCYDCTVVKLTDNGDGTARIFWDTSNPPVEPGGPYTIQIFALNKKDESKITWSSLEFWVTAPSTAAIKWEPLLGMINVNYGGTVDVLVKATGGSDTQITCENCTLVTATDKGDGTARIFWDTSKVVGLIPGSYYLNLTAKSKSKPANSVFGVLELFVQNPAPIAGAPQWTSDVGTVLVKPGEVSVVKISATGGAATALDCPSCTQVVLKDNGDGTADLTWDTSKSPNLTFGLYTVNVRAFVKTDPAKVTLGQINYMYMASPFGGGGATTSSPTGTTTPANSITAEYLKGKYGVPPGYTGPIPACAFSGTCRSTSDLVILLINIAKFLFSMIGVVAFAAFMYGGFMMIFSFGSSDKVTQGKDAMVAAVIGLVIAFGAYMIINFILNALGVGAEFRGVID